MELIKYLFKSDACESIEEFSSVDNDQLKPFSSEAIEFVGALSKILLRLPDGKQYPELIALGYWLRKAHIERLKNEALRGGLNYAPRGNVFHIAPSNVDTIFIYSLVVSLLMGNKNLVRLSSKPSAQRDLILSALRHAADSLPSNQIKHKLLIVTYPHNDELTEKFSLLCDVRMIWGGDSTINSIANLKSKPTSIDLKFANKYSFSVLSLRKVAELDDTELQKLAKEFINDSYTFAQQGCSSPRAVFWLDDDSSDTDDSIARFWCAVDSRLQVYDDQLADGDFTEKLVFSASHAIRHKSMILSAGTNAVLTVIGTDLSSAFEAQEHCGRGVFLQSRIDSLDSLNKHLSRGIQTVTYFGLSKALLEGWVAKNLNGIDRIVPIGQGLDFDYLWDGFNLFESVSRIVSIK